MQLPSLAAALLSALAALAAGSKEDTPVSKVISLLEDLKSEIETEGAAEAGTYDTFACFCKDKTGTKSTAITEGSDTIDTLSGDITDDTATMEEKSTELQEKKKKLEKLKADLEAETDRCLKEAAEFEAALADLSKACFALEKALEAMKGGMPTLLQLKGNSGLGKEVAAAVKLGQALGLVGASSGQAAASLLQVDPADPEYKYHSDSIVELLDKLKIEFDGKKTETQSEFDKAKNICSETKTQLSDDIDETDGEIGSLEDDIDGLKVSIADNRMKLIDSEAELKDNKVYLKDLTQQCETAAKTWDQRSVARAQELEALTQALALLKGDDLVTGIDDHAAAAVDRALIQQQTPAVAAAAPPSFLQQASRSLAVRSKASEVDRKHQVEQVLREASERLGSPVLAELASQVGGDPFKKVKNMIQELIERLLDEAKKEATKQGFCDTQLGKAYQDRDYRLSDAKKLAAEIGVARSTNETLTADIDELEEVLPELYKALNESTVNRAENKEENLARIKTAKEGFSAVTEAIVILKTYYKQAAKALLLQRRASPVDEATDGPGFEGPYKGKQDSSKGIIGLLEVIKTDFDRCVRKTTEEEQQQQKDFVEFERVTKSDISGKETALELKTEDRAKVMAAIAKDLSDLNTTQGLLDDALKTVEDLTPMCINMGMSYADRVAKREQEIAALKSCIDILTPPSP